MSASETASIYVQNGKQFATVFIEDRILKSISKSVVNDLEIRSMQADNERPIYLSKHASILW